MRTFVPSYEIFDTVHNLNLGTAIMHDTATKPAKYSKRTYRRHRKRINAGPQKPGEPQQWDRPNKKGTSVFVIGFWDIDNFKSEVIREVLRNYWFAIAEKQLVVQVEDESLNADNVGEYIELYFPDYRDYRTFNRWFLWI